MDSEDIIKLPWVEGKPDPDGVIRNGWYHELWLKPLDGAMQLVGLEIRSVRDPDAPELPGPMTLTVGQVRPRKRHADPDAPVLQLKPRPLTKTVLKELDLAGMLEEAKAKSKEVAEAMRKRHPVMEAELTRRLDEWNAAKRPQRGGEPAKPDEHYREVAEVYNAEVARLGYLAKPRKAVMDHFEAKTGERPSKSLATTWVSRARRRGLIDPAPERGLHAGWKEENR